MSELDRPRRRLLSRRTLFAGAIANAVHQALSDRPKTSSYQLDNVALAMHRKQGNRSVVSSLIELHSAYQTLMQFDKPWTHQILLNGATSKEAFNFANALHRRLTVGPESKAMGYQETMSMVLSELATEHFPEREFWSPTFRVHELRSSEAVAHAEESDFSIRNTVSYAYESGVPLEIGYRSLREDWNRNIVPQTHVRRVNVRSVDATGFRAKHGRGYRRYSFDKVEWAIAEGYTPQNVGYEPVIDLKLSDSKAVAKVDLTVATTETHYRSMLRSN
jgi:hypothetical protein